MKAGRERIVRKQDTVFLFLELFLTPFCSLDGCAGFCLAGLLSRMLIVDK